MLLCGNILLTLDIEKMTFLPSSDMWNRIKRFINIFYSSLLILLVSNGALAQSYILKGTVLDKDSSFALPNSYVVNNKTFALGINTNKNLGVALNGFKN